MKSTSLANSVSFIIFSPTITAYGLLCIKYIASGLALYMISLGVGYVGGLFRRLRDWPGVSGAALMASPLLVAFGLYCSTQEPGYWMILPMAIYMLLSIAGGFALRQLG